MLRKLLIYPSLIVLALLGALAVYYYTSDEATSEPHITIENITLRLPAPGQSTAAAYFDIINTGGADELLSAASPVSSPVELHTHLHEDGIMKMRKVKTVKIQGQHTTAFHRGGLHVMMFNTAIIAETKSVPLTLTFARTGTVNVIAIIE